MSKPAPNEQPDSAAVLESMTLLATLSTAAEIRTSVVERRSGRDPSAQEPPDRAASRLRAAGRDLMELLMQIALSRVPLEQRDEGRLPHAVRHFDLLLKLRRGERLAQKIHQALLSLYPEVSEELVEEARRVRTEVARFLEAPPPDPDGPHLSDLLERGISLVVWTRHEVSVGQSGDRSAGDE